MASAEEELTLSPYAAAALAEFLREQEEAQRKLESLNESAAGMPSFTFFALRSRADSYHD
jgi:hypothetical protein